MKNGIITKIPTNIRPKTTKIRTNHEKIATRHEKQIARTILLNKLYKIT